MRFVMGAVFWQQNLWLAPQNRSFEEKFKLV
jgi:hypothetical protein